MALQLEPGQLVANRFHLVGLIGKGAVGSVWRAKDAQRDGGEVALKLIVPLDSEGRLSKNKLGRFVREAKAMSRLKSPFVVHVFDHGAIPDPEGDQDELVYITMELLVGEPLRTRIKRDGGMEV
ncbi:MAG: hypothetical protein AAGA56_23550, partial [Myxococcota bacterium]